MLYGGQGHSYALLASAARRLHQCAMSDESSFDSCMEDIVTGAAPGLVCGQCGMTLEEVIASNVLCIETSPLSYTACRPRSGVVRELIACDLVGARPLVCFDVLQPMGDPLAAPPWRRRTILTLREAVAKRIFALMATTGGVLPVMGAQPRA